MTNATHQGAKGVVHLQFVALHFSKYWCTQRRTPVRIALNDPEELTNLINMGKQWEPTISHSFAGALKLNVLGPFS